MQYFIFLDDKSFRFNNLFSIYFPLSSYITYGPPKKRGKKREDVGYESNLIVLG
jgi:hypothetical protein